MQLKRVQVVEFEVIRGIKFSSKEKDGVVDCYRFTTPSFSFANFSDVCITILSDFDYNISFYNSNFSCCRV